MPPCKVPNSIRANEHPPFFTRLLSLVSISNFDKNHLRGEIRPYKTSILDVERRNRFRNTRLFRLSINMYSIIYSRQHVDISGTESSNPQGLFARNREAREEALIGTANDFYRYPFFYSRIVIDECLYDHDRVEETPRKRAERKKRLPASRPRVIYEQNLFRFSEY